MVTFKRSAGGASSSSAALREKRKDGRLPEVSSLVAVSSIGGGAEPGNLVPILLTQQRPPPFRNQP